MLTLGRRGGGALESSRSACGSIGARHSSGFYRRRHLLNLVEQPARLGLDDESLLQQWKPAYERGFRMQASLALIGGALGLIAAYALHDWRWAAGGVALLGNWPFTLLAIMPVNRRLMAIAPGSAGAETRRLIVKWGALHAMRSALGVVATLIFLWASLR